MPDKHCFKDLFNDVEDTFTLDNISLPITTGDALKLTEWNIKHDFRNNNGTDKTGKNISLAENLIWRRNITELVVLIFKKTCPKTYVTDAFINVIRELYLIYHKSLVNPKDIRNETWPRLRTNLQQCLAHITETKLELNSTGYEVPYLSGSKIGLLLLYFLGYHKPVIILNEFMTNLLFRFSI